MQFVVCYIFIPCCRRLERNLTFRNSRESKKKKTSTFFLPSSSSTLSTKPLLLLVLLTSGPLLCFTRMAPLPAHQTKHVKKLEYDLFPLERIVVINQDDTVEQSSTGRTVWLGAQVRSLLLELRNREGRTKTFFSFFFVVRSYLFTFRRFLKVINSGQNRMELREGSDVLT